MKKIITLLILCNIFSSCSSLRKSMTSGALVGAVIGGLAGSIFSPNTESVPGNAFMLGGLGAAAGAGLAYAFYTSDPENKEFRQMLTSDPTPKPKDEVPLFDFSPSMKEIKPDVEFKPIKKFEVPLEKLPPELQGKVKRQYLLEYETQGKTIQYEGRTIEISPFKAWEHVYEN
ncbi:MAG: hypothetical protein ACOYL6_17425 [Bacteriovoracaceae bacterium]